MSPVPNLGVDVIITKHRHEIVTGRQGAWTRDSHGPTVKKQKNDNTIGHIFKSNIRLNTAIIHFVASNKNGPGFEVTPMVSPDHSSSPVLYIVLIVIPTAYTDCKYSFFRRAKTQLRQGSPGRAHYQTTLELIGR